MDIDTEPGRGTRVHVFLPYVEGRPGRSEATRPRESSNLQIRVWLLEDSYDVARVICRELRAQGATVAEASNLAQARELLDSQEPPDLFLSDVVLPDGHGPDFVAELRERSPKVPVLFISGHPLNDDVSRQIEELGDGYLVKPFTTFELLDAISKALAVRQAKNGSNDAK
jgi:DNA-binding response OmpR family regulator